LQWRKGPTPTGIYDQLEGLNAGSERVFRDREKLRRKIKSRRKNECKRKKVPKTPKNNGNAGFGESFLISVNQRSSLPKGDLIREHEPVRSTFLIFPS
jgi:hypothetical protein